MVQEIYIIILNYNNANDTIECINSIRIATKNCNSYAYHIIIVDNASSDDSVMILQNFIGNDIELVVASQNLGYAAGNNIGIRHALRYDPDYLVILNNDTVIDRNTISCCIKALENDNNLGIAGPVILNYGTNIIQSSGADVDFYKLISIPCNADKVYYPKNTVEYHDYVGGACLVFNAELIKKIGYLPEQYFLFWEETEWCILAQRSGKKVGCVYNASIQHKGSATIKRTNTKSDYYLERNRVIFSKRNSPSLYIKIISIIRLFASAFKNGIFKDKNYFNYLKYYIDGLFS